MQWPHVATLAMVPPQVKFHTHEYEYKGYNLASAAVTLYHSGYSPSLSIIYSCCQSLHSLGPPALGVYHVETSTS